MMAEDLQGDKTRIHCDLERLYRDIRNVRAEACLNVQECDEQCFEDGYPGVIEIRNDPYSNKCGCYMKNDRCYWNSCGNNQAKSTESMPGQNERVWCAARLRTVRDVVSETCLNIDECNIQGAIDDDVKIPAIEKDFYDSDTNCGCYKKGGQLYWALCGNNGNYYGDLGGQKERVHCYDVASSSAYRLFNRNGVHSHAVSVFHYVTLSLAATFDLARCTLLVLNQSFCSSFLTALTSSLLRRSRLGTLSNIKSSHKASFTVLGLVLE